MPAEPSMMWRAGNKGRAARWRQGKQTPFLACLTRDHLLEARIGGVPGVQAGDAAVLVEKTGTAFGGGGGGVGVNI